MVDLTIFRDELHVSMEQVRIYQAKISKTKLKSFQLKISCPENSVGYGCVFEFLLKNDTIPSHIDLDILCHHEEECKIVSRLIKKFRKENLGIALILTIKMETYKTSKLPEGKLKL